METKGFLKDDTKISIIILTHNRSILLGELLASLKNLDYRSLEIIVVDNASEDNTENIVKESSQTINYIRMSKNIGAGARNAGLKIAGGDVIVTLDDDISGIDTSHLRKISHFFRTRPKLGAVNFKIFDYKSGEICNWVHHRPVERYAEKEFETYELTEGAVAFRKEALLAAGYYPESFFLSHEGPDLAFRLMDLGYNVIYSSEIQVRHKHSDLGRIDWLNYYYDTRNQFWLAVRNFPWLYSTGYLARGLGAMLLYSIRDGYLRYWGKAVLDGALGIPRELKNRKILKPETLNKIFEMDRERPSVFVLLRQRLRKKGARL